MKSSAQFNDSTKVARCSVAVALSAVTDHMTKKKIKDQLQQQSSEVCSIEVHTTCVCVLRVSTVTTGQWYPTVYPVKRHNMG